jgi:hypothetical protein
MKVIRKVGMKFGAAKRLHQSGIRAAWFRNGNGDWEIDFSKMPVSEAILAKVMLA